MKHLFEMWRWLLLLGLLAMGRFSAHAQGGTCTPVVPGHASLGDITARNCRLPL